MGYDYCIVKILEVTYINDDDDEIKTDIEVNKQNCYFYDENEDTDSDSTSDTSYGSKTGKLYEKYLKVNYIPKVLFSNNKWKNEKLREKYENNILNEINNGMILHIVKKEIRYPRR